MVRLRIPLCSPAARQSRPRKTPGDDVLCSRNASIRFRWTHSIHADSPENIDAINPGSERARFIPRPNCRGGFANLEGGQNVAGDTVQSGPVPWRKTRVFEMQIELSHYLCTELGKVLVGHKLRAGQRGKQGYGNRSCVKDRGGMMGKVHPD